MINMQYECLLAASGMDSVDAAEFHGVDEEAIYMWISGDEEPTFEDVPDPAIFELSQGLLKNGIPGAIAPRPWVADSGERHVFQHPAQDDRAGICMRLPAAKEIRRRFETLVPEITMYCGAVGGSVLSAGVNQWETSGAFTQTRS